MHKIRSIFIFISILFISLNAIADSKVEHKIAVLVNEELISSYDILQRLKLKALIQKIENNNQNSQLIVRNVVDELIQEKIKLEKINEYQIIIEEDEYIEFELDFLKRRNITKKDLLLLLDKNNINYKDIKNLLISELSWSKLVSGLFYRLTSVSEQEIKEIINKNPNITPEQAKNLVIQRQSDLQSSKLLRDMTNEATIEYK